MKTGKYWRRTTTYRRKGWTDKRIDRGLKTSSVYVVRQDVGRPKKHYMDMYYKGKRGKGKLVKTVIKPYKK